MRDGLQEGFWVLMKVLSEHRLRTVAVSSGGGYLRRRRLSGGFVVQEVDNRTQGQKQVHQRNQSHTEQVQKPVWVFWVTDIRSSLCYTLNPLTPPDPNPLPLDLVLLRTGFLFPVLRTPNLTQIPLTLHKLGEPSVIFLLQDRILTLETQDPDIRISKAQTAEEMSQDPSWWFIRSPPSEKRWIARGRHTIAPPGRLCDP